MTEPETYKVRLGCMACGAISVYGGIPVGTYWFDHFEKDGVECDSCRCQMPPTLIAYL